MREINSTEVKASDRPERTRIVPKSSALREPEAPSFEDDEEEDFFWRARCTGCSLSGRFEFFGDASVLKGSHEQNTSHRVEISRTGLYHVVCRDCPVERLCDSESGVTWLEEVHEEASGHRVDYAEVTRA